MTDLISTFTVFDNKLQSPFKKRNAILTKCFNISLYTQI